MKKSTIALLLIAALLGISTYLIAQQTAASKAKLSDIAEESVFTIPDGTMDELKTHFAKINSHRPNITSEVELAAFRARWSAAMIELAEKMLAQNPKDDDLVLARRIKFTGLMGNGMLDAEKGLPALETYAAELEKEAGNDPSAKDLAAETRLGLLQVKVHQIQGQPDAAEKILALSLEAKPYIEQNLTARAAFFVNEVLFDAAQNVDKPPFPVLQKLIDEFKPVLSKSDDPRFKQALERMEGDFRQLTLVGKEMELEAVLLNGEKINIQDLKGKVVLVDFWATWCGPCLGEIPNMKKQYEKYHDQGFEIIAYSVDRDLNALKKFEESDPHPWPVVSLVMSQEKNLTNYADFYGVRGIPTMILVGKDGKVISTEARGTTLNRELEKLFPKKK
ncbi:MAG: TlpA family protein disulfide reductase [Planctomycetaceae bacterium]|jgi:thiol-disulfide isomerase/thioredoxin|nr:TlpA family protein disulfide reductase [Planctomycetaceae bacterium]